MNPAACTALIRVWFGAGFPQLVTWGSPSKELPKFHPGGMTLTTCSGVRAPPEPASAPLEFEEPESPDEPSPEVEEAEPVSEAPDEASVSEALDEASVLVAAEFASLANVASAGGVASVVEIAAEPPSNGGFGLPPSLPAFDPFEDVPHAESTETTTDPAILDRMRTGISTFR